MEDIIKNGFQDFKLIKQAFQNNCKVIPFDKYLIDDSKNFKKVENKEIFEIGKYPVVDQSDQKIAGYTSKYNLIDLDEPRLVFGDHTKVIKYIDFPFIRGADGTKVLKLIDNNNSYLYAYFYLSWVSKYLPELGYSRNYKNLKSVNIILPSIVKQNKISNILCRLKNIISTRKAQIAALDELVQSVFYEMFGDPLSNNFEYKVLKLNQVSDVRDGTHDSPKYINEGYPLITSKNVTSDGLILDKVNYISEEDFIKINKRSEVNNGDIIMPMIGTVGRPYIVNENFDFAIKNLALIKLGDELLNVYLKYLLSERYIGAKFELKGGTQKFISLKLLRNLKIPLPPLELQEQFAAKVEAIEAQKAKLQTSLEKMETLFDALMQEAFSGNLG